MYAGICILVMMCCCVGAVVIVCAVYESIKSAFRWITFRWIRFKDNEFDVALKRIRELEQINKSLMYENDKIHADYERIESELRAYKSVRSE